MLKISEPSYLPYSTNMFKSDAMVTVEFDALFIIHYLYSPYIFVINNYSYKFVTFFLCGPQIGSTHH